MGRMTMRRTKGTASVLAPVLPLILLATLAACRTVGPEALVPGPSDGLSNGMSPALEVSTLKGVEAGGRPRAPAAIEGRAVESALASRASSLTPPPTSAMRPVGGTAAPYRAVEGGRFELTRAVRFDTRRFGPVVLTKGYRSDGSSSPIADVEGSRLAGFLHDALYAASGHLRFPGGAPARWTKAEADDAYCAEMARRGVPAWHARANCTGVRGLPHIAVAWRRLEPKRERRWAQWAARPATR